MIDLLKQLPFLRLDGPHFLDFYGVVALAVLAVAWIALRLADRTDRRPPPPVPPQLDPIETAWLVGGVNNVARTLLYDLYQHGYAHLVGSDRVGPGHRKPEPGALDAPRQRVLDSVRSTPKIEDVFKNVTMRRELEAMCAPMVERLRRDDLLQPKAVRSMRKRVLIFGCLVLLGLAGAKLALALSLGKSNVSFLVMLALFACASLVVLGAYMTKHAASRRGRAWLERLKLAHAGRLTEAAERARDYHEEPSGAYAFEGASLALIGLYGFEALRDTPDKAFGDAFKRASSDSSSSGCGSSSSCGSGDGGGGGCGGCGGGGD